MKKILATVMSIALILVLFSGCGRDGAGNGSGGTISGSCEEILNAVYEKADFDQGFRDSMDSYVTNAIDETTQDYILGTDAVKYTDSACSMPLVTATAYQCVILRLAEGEDAEAAKKALRDNAAPRKWVCVEPESIIVENAGDVILYIMADKEIAEAVKTAFLGLKSA